MNRTIKDATVKRYLYDTHDQLKAHLTDFLRAYNFARRLKTLHDLTPYEYLCKLWTQTPDRSTLDPSHQMLGLNTAVFVLSLLVVFPVGNDEVDASFLQPFCKRVGVVGTVGGHPFRLRSRPPLGLGTLTSASMESASEFSQKRHFQAGLPAEERHCRPVPSTSYRCHAWFADCGGAFFTEA
jgi:hypothetical protein